MTEAEVRRIINEEFINLLENYQEIRGHTHPVIDRYGNWTGTRPFSTHEVIDTLIKRLEEKDDKESEQ